MMDLAVELRPRFRVLVIPGALARALAPHLPAAPAAVAVLGSEGLARALARLGYATDVPGGDGAAATVLADRPDDAALDDAARLLADGGRLVVVDRGWRRHAPDARTYALARRGFVEIGQRAAGRAALTEGIRRRV